MRLCCTAEENINAFYTKRHAFSCVEDFLRCNDLHIPIRSTQVSELEQDAILEIECDIDGIVVQMNGFKALSMPLHELKFTLRPGVFHCLKKHLTLSNYSQKGIQVLKDMEGLEMFHERGWKIFLCLLPLENVASFDTKPLWAIYQQEVTNIFRNLSAEDTKRPTIQRNNLSNLKGWNLSPGDQGFVLGKLDQALQALPIPDQVKPYVFATQFGQKDHAVVDLAGDFNMAFIYNISIHSAFELSVTSLHLLWSRTGLQELLGNRGIMYTALSFAECANYQSNLDHRKIDLSANLRSMSAFPGLITFVQAYATTPHRHPDRYYQHPVTGCLATLGTLHPKTNKMLADRAQRFLNVMRENAEKLVGPITARLEFVTKHDLLQMPTLSLDADKYINLGALRKVLREHALVIPFSDFIPDVAGEPSTFTLMLKEVVSHLVGELGNLFAHHREEGGFLNCWKAFQMELALEKMIWGKPIFNACSIYATNLGPGGLRIDRSISWSRGFLGLEAATACAIDENTCPPVSLWTQNKVQQRRVRDIFNFSDFLKSNHAVMGERYILILINDLSGDWRSDILLAATKAHDLPQWCRLMGSVTLEVMANTIVEKAKQCRYPAVSQFAARMIERAGHQMKDVVMAGLKEMKIRHFPKMRKSTDGNTKHMNWNRHEMYEILEVGQPSSMKALSASLSEDVLAMLETKAVTFSRNLLPLRERGMPWMEPVVTKLQVCHLTREEQLAVCCFVTAVALLENNVYISYLRLNNVELDMPLTQRRLQELHISSKLLLPKLNNVKVFRLHERIPVRIPPPQAAPAGRKRRAGDEPADIEQPIEITEEDQPFEEEEQDFQAYTSQHRVATYKGYWKGEELSLLDMLAEEGYNPGRAAYERYMQLCKEHHAADRDYHSFRCRYKRFLIK